MALFLALGVGFFAVIQSGMNRFIIDRYGVTHTIFINGLVFLLFSALLYPLLKYTPLGDIDVFKLKPLDTKIWWWIWIPGFVGFCLVTSLPLAMSKIGAARAIVAMMAAQIFASLLWDLFVEKIPVNLTRLLGALVTFLGVYMASK